MQNVVIDACFMPDSSVIHLQVQDPLVLLMMTHLVEQSEKMNVAFINFSVSFMVAGL